jgi:K+-transporting ATPase ATPase C chain
VKQLIVSIRAVLALSVLTGGLYPLVMTGLAHVFFRTQANGSLIRVGDTYRGSRLIGQNFSDPKYFWGRLSATGPTAYNGASSAGSNVGPLNPALLEAVQRRIDSLRAVDPENVEKIPVDLVTASGSGLDPHITLAAARYQLKRVARVRGMSEKIVSDLISENIDGSFLGILGEPGVNVLKLNLALSKEHDSLPLPLTEKRRRGKENN